MNSHPVARESQDGEFTQPRSDLLEHLCTVIIYVNAKAVATCQLDAIVIQSRACGHAIGPAAPPPVHFELWHLSRNEMILSQLQKNTNASLTTPV